MKMPIPLVWPSKDPDEILDYQLDWSDRLLDDVIVTSEWFVPGDLVMERATVETSSTTLWISGGVLGIIYEIVNRITTEGGRTMDQTVRLPLSKR